VEDETEKGVPRTSVKILGKKAIWDGKESKAARVDGWNIKGGGSFSQVPLADRAEKHRLTFTVGDGENSLRQRKKTRKNQKLGLSKGTRSKSPIAQFAEFVRSRVPEGGEGVGWGGGGNR